MFTVYMSDDTDPSDTEGLRPYRIDRRPYLTRNQAIAAIVGVIVISLPIVLAVIDGIIAPVYNDGGMFIHAPLIAIYVIAILGTIMAVWVCSWLAVMRYNGIRAETNAALAALERSQTDGKDFTALWLDNRKRLNIYHDLVTGYAHSTRLATIATIAVGFAFIITVSAIAVFAKETSGAVASSIIGAGGALLTGFIANAVLKNAASSQSELLSFFSHPLEVERALSAERVISNIEDPREKATSQRLLVEHLTRCRSTEGQTGPEPKGL